MGNRVGLLLTSLAALLLITPTPPFTPTERDERLDGCRELGVYPVPQPYVDVGNYSIASPDGTYVVSGRHLGSHGCHDIIIYQCVNQQASPTIGCEGIFPPESREVVLADEWVSDHELRITRKGQTQVIDARLYFSANAVRSTPADQQLGMSPDGTWMIFNSWRDGMPELYRMRLDGSDVQRLTRSIGIETLYGWSPDGAWMILDYALPYQLPLPHRMRPDGSAIEPLISEAGSWQTLAFSPDSRWLLVQGYAPDAKTDGLNTVIYRVSIPDGALTRLTDPAFSYWFESWSPDGRALTFTWTGRANERGFDLIDLDTGVVTRLIEGNFAEFYGWIDDHAAGVFGIYDAESGTRRLYRADQDGTTIRPIARPS